MNYKHWVDDRTLFTALQPIGGKMQLMKEEITLASIAVMASFKGKPHLLRVSEVAEIFGFSRASVYRLIDNGDLQVARPVLSGTRGSVRVLRDSAESLLLQWMEAEENAEPISPQKQVNKHG